VNPFLLTKTCKVTYVSKCVWKFFSNKTRVGPWVSATLDKYSVWELYRDFKGFKKKFRKRFTEKYELYAERPIWSKINIRMLFLVILLSISKISRPSELYRRRKNSSAAHFSHFLHSILFMPLGQTSSIFILHANFTKNFSLLKNCKNFFKVSIR